MGNKGQGGGQLEAFQCLAKTLRTVSYSDGTSSNNVKQRETHSFRFARYVDHFAS